MTIFAVKSPYETVRAGYDEPITLIATFPAVAMTP